MIERPDSPLAYHDISTADNGGVPRYYWVMVEVQVPHKVSTNTAVGISLAGMKVSASYSAFFNIT